MKDMDQPATKQDFKDMIDTIHGLMEQSGMEFGIDRKRIKRVELKAKTYAEALEELRQAIRNFGTRVDAAETDITLIKKLVTK